MQATAIPRESGPLATFRAWPPRRPSWRRALAVVLLICIALGASTVASTLAYLRLPAPTGPLAVGKAATVWPVGDGPRRIRVTAWYPADAGSGTTGRYVEDLDAIDDALVASGQIGAFEVAGLGLVQDPARLVAAVAGGDGVRYPLIVLSPGNATNVEFYGALAEDLASHGYVVIGIDHPGQVAAVALGDEVIGYAGDPPLGAAGSEIPRLIDERVADIGAVLDGVAGAAPGLESVARQVDLTRIGVMGHSNGGVAAALACHDPRVRACLNLDGQSAGGPFGTREGSTAPEKPFLYVTKETDLHPVLGAAFEDGGMGTFRVVIPAAAHDQFADGALFRPRVLPTASVADAVITVSRGFALAFFEHTLRAAPRTVFGEVDAPTDVKVYVYPLERP